MLHYDGGHCSFRSPQPILFVSPVSVTMLTQLVLSLAPYRLQGWPEPEGFLCPTLLLTGQDSSAPNTLEDEERKGAGRGADEERESKSETASRLQSVLVVLFAEFCSGPKPCQSSDGESRTKLLSATAAGARRSLTQPREDYF